MSMSYKKTGFLRVSNNVLMCGTFPPERERESERQHVRARAHAHTLRARTYGKESKRARRREKV